LKKNFTKQEKKVARSIQGDLPIDKRPFRNLGDLTGLAEEEVVRTVTGLIRKGYIRKFGAVIRHQKAGYTQNAMVVWAVPEHRRDETGKILASFPEVTHCYERTPLFEGKYAIFTMVHFRSGETKTVIQKLADATGIKDFKILISEEEYKKSSMEYF
jgi:DNA-binding Lrp family transcriptional regulator